MDELVIKATKDTPAIFFDPLSGSFEISGRSLPEDANAFYEIAIDWLRRYNDLTMLSAATLVIKLEYFNTASSKLLLDLFHVWEKGSSFNKVVWCYEKNDQDMFDAGKDYSDMLTMTFEFKKF